MTAAEVFEGITQIGLIVLYAAAFWFSLSAHKDSASHARRRSAIGLMVISVSWLVFYLLIADPWPFTTPPESVLWSRAAHYVTASSLISMALMIRTAEQAQRTLIIESDPAIVEFKQANGGGGA